MPALWQSLTQKVADTKAAALKIIEAAEAGNREFTADERATLTDLKAKREALEGDLAFALDARDAERATVREVVDANEQAVEAKGKYEEKAKADLLPRPFKSLGEQLAAVADAARNPYSQDKRLAEIMAAGTGANEASQSDGGFRVQVDFSSELIQLVHATAILAGKTDTTPIGPNSNGLKINAIDETSRVDGSRWGAVQAYWIAEGAALTASRPKYRQIELSLQKLTGLYYATDELLMDATALGAEATTAFTEEFGFKIDDAIIRGTGAGMPLGILSHAGTISISKETGQAASTLVKDNIDKMWARMIASSMSKAEWYINQDVWPQLLSLSMTVGVGGMPVFLNAGSIAGAPFGAIYGRPVTPIEQCATLGTVGDIIFADFSQYKMIEKGGINADSSIHVAFLTDETVFRWTMRTDGQPKRNAALTPYKGTNTLSPFITLATRA